MNRPWLLPRARLAFRFLLCLAVVVSSSPRVVSVAELPIVSEIRIEGNVNVSESSIRQSIHLHRGDPYSPDVIDEDVRRLWAMGCFRDVSVETDRLPDKTLRVTYYVKEKPTVIDVRIRGNDNIKDKKIFGVIATKVGAYLSYFNLRQDEREILNIYHEKCYQFARVHTKVVEKAEGAVVTFSIEEGPRVRIRKIEFEGNKSIKTATLKKLMHTRAYKFIFSSGAYDEDTFRSDLEAIKDYYRGQGFLDVKVARDIRYSDDKTRMYLKVIIREGPRYTVEHLIISGNKLFTGREIRRRLRVTEGKPFVRDNLQADRQAIRALYGEQGFVDARVRARTFFNEKEPRLTLRYEISEGERIYIEDVRIVGNHRIKDNVIRRELTFVPGERINTKKIAESRQNLINTGYFAMGPELAAEGESGKGPEPPVDIQVEPGSRPNWRRVVVKVNEGRTGYFMIGAGVSSNIGLVGDVAYTQRNFDIADWPKSFSDFIKGDAFVGAGQILTLRANPGTRRQQYTISFEDPSVFDSPYSFGTSFFYYDRLRESYDEQRVGGTASIGRKITKYLTLRLSYGLEDIRIYNLDDCVPRDVYEAKGHHTKSSIRLSAYYDRTDSRFFPTRGYKLRTSIENAGSFMGGDVDTIKWIGSGRYYKTLFTVPRWGKHVLSVGGTLGVVDATRGDKVPIFERFFAGGAGSIRGFSFRDASPRGYGCDDPVGGKVLMLGNVEYEFPILGDVLRGVAFCDVGKADRKLSDLDFNRMRVAAGFGFRLRLPFFGQTPMAFDFGFPISKERGDDTQVFSFTIGGFFF